LKAAGGVFAYLLAAQNRYNHVPRDQHELRLRVHVSEGGTQQQEIPLEAVPVRTGQSRWWRVYTWALGPATE
jgi:hypothetical protein